MRYFVRMNYATSKPLTLYRLDTENAVEELWFNSHWVESPNVIVESLFKSGELEEVTQDYAEDNFQQAFSRA